MDKLQTSYLGLKLKNPIIISSSGLTNTVEKNIALEKAGAGAIVLKSLFEEQIMMTSDNLLKNSDYTEAYDYINNYVESHDIKEYLDLISGTKKNCRIPVIASINCHKTGDWANFAHKIELAGADALELNIFILNTDPKQNSDSFEQSYIDIVQSVKNVINIPVIVKLGTQFTNIVGITEKLMSVGASSVVLFNRFYQPDINLDTMEIKQGTTFSSPSDFSNTLRWTGIISGSLKNSSIVTSTGVHSWENAIKSILVGADAVQICSTIYKNGNNVISEIIKGIESWMQKHGYENISEFKGKLNYANSIDPTMYERSQFMKYYASDNNDQ